MPIIDLSKQWEIVSCILIEHIVFNNNHLQLFHSKPSIHLYCALIYEINNTTLCLNLLAAILQSRSRLFTAIYNRMRNLFCFSSFFFFIFVKNCLKYFFCLFLAFVKAVMICADNHNSKIYSEISNVNMKDELF